MIQLDIVAAWDGGMLFAFSVFFSFDSRLGVLCLHPDVRKKYIYTEHGKLRVLIDELMQLLAWLVLTTSGT